MVQNYMEETNEKPFRGRNRCNCFNGNTNDSSDDEFDVFDGGFGESIISNGPPGDANDILKVRFRLCNLGSLQISRLFSVVWTISFEKYWMNL
ncbi:hypothetical protein LINPERHAP1_LOCUS36450 [Linum perenne]